MDQKVNAPYVTFDLFRPQRQIRGYLKKLFEFSLQKITERVR
jgi:hypothetical protein